MLNLKIKYHSDDIPRLKKIDKGDWIDLYSAEDVTLAAGDFKIISLGISVEIPEGYEMNIAPRSSTFKTWGIIQTNHFGVIDNSYCGDDDIIMMPVYATRDVEIKKGDKLCHFRLNKQQEPINFIEVESLSNKNRGGFGSTGAR